MMTPTKVNLSEPLTQFLMDYHKDDIKEFAYALTDRRLVTIKFSELQARDPDVAGILLTNPTEFMESATKLLHSILYSEGIDMQTAKEFYITISGIPESEKVSIDQLGSEHLGRLIVIDGIVKKSTDVIPVLTKAVFVCRTCTMPNEVRDYMLAPFPPTKCETCESKKLVLDPRLSTHENRQKLVLQENPEGSRGKAKPGEIQVTLPQWMVRICDPGDRVQFTGTLMTKLKAKGSAECTMLFEPLAYDVREKDYEEIQITEQDEARIKKLATDTDPIDAIRSSFMPSIYGMDIEKEAMVLALFGGVTRTNNDGSKSRGDIHILMVGDPGVAKSQLLYGLRDIAPRAVFTSGKGASAAGLTATVTKDELNDGQWTLEAGAMVLADKGILLLDEMDKMQKGDMSAMHQAMEQQEISIAKAGITATLKSRCPVIAAANPKFGRYSQHDSMADQINMPPALLSRFDVVFPILDRPNKERDTAIAKHILKAGRYAEAYLEAPFVRKYVAYAKRLEPELSDEASSIIEDYYVRLRINPNVENVTARQLMSIRRLAEAAARCRLKSVAGKEEAEVAISIHQYYMNVSGGSDLENGKWDLGNTSGAGRTRSQMDRIMTLRTLIDELAQATPDTGANEDDIFHVSESRGLTKAQVEKDLSTLRRNNEIMQKGSNGWVRVR